MRIAAFDYSITCPCLCIYEYKENKSFFDCCRFYYITNTKKFIGNFNGNIIGIENTTINDSNEEKYKQNRYAFNAECLIQFLKKDDIVYIEGYSYNSVQGLIFNIAENCSILKHILNKNGHEINVVPPAIIKKFATGKGNANKQLLEESFIKKTNINLKEILKQTSSQWNPSSDIIDSYFLAKYVIKK